MALQQQLQEQETLQPAQASTSQLKHRRRPLWIGWVQQPLLAQLVPPHPLPLQLQRLQLPRHRLLARAEQHRSRLGSRSRRRLSAVLQRRQLLLDLVQAEQHLLHSRQRSATDMVPAGRRTRCPPIRCVLRWKQWTRSQGRVAASTCTVSPSRCAAAWACAVPLPLRLGQPAALATGRQHRRLRRQAIARYPSPSSRARSAWCRLTWMR